MCVCVQCTSVPFVCNNVVAAVMRVQVCAGVCVCCTHAFVLGAKEGAYLHLHDKLLKGKPACRPLREVSFAGMCSLGCGRKVFVDCGREWPKLVEVVEREG